MGLRRWGDCEQFLDDNGGRYKEYPEEEAFKFGDGENYTSYKACVFAVYFAGTPFVLRASL
eukprot:15449192-Alexandrium_andersonii.AAC.1